VSDAFDVARDSDGVRIALEEIFEEDFARSRIERESEGAAQETRQRMESQIPARTLSPGYYAFAEHLLLLEAWQKAGVVFAPAGLAAWEASGLVAIGRARNGFKSRHPPCSRCGAPQQNRFTAKCHACGAKFKHAEG
jgi:ribosomal protein L37E